MILTQSWSTQSLWWKQHHQLRSHGQYQYLLLSWPVKLREASPLKNSAENISESNERNYLWRLCGRVRRLCFSWKLHCCQGKTHFNTDERFPLGVFTLSRGECGEMHHNFVHKLNLPQRTVGKVLSCPRCCLACSPPNYTIVLFITTHVISRQTKKYPLWVLHWLWQIFGAWDETRFALGSFNIAHQTSLDCVSSHKIYPFTLEMTSSSVVEDSNFLSHVFSNRFNNSSLVSFRRSFPDHEFLISKVFREFQTKICVVFETTVAAFYLRPWFLLALTFLNFANLRWLNQGNKSE